MPMMDINYQTPGARGAENPYTLTPSLAQAE
jgi:hypothetical protein